MARSLLVFSGVLLAVGTWGLAAAPDGIDVASGTSADEGIWFASRSERGDSHIELGQPVAMGHQPRALLEQWLDRIGVGRERLQRADGSVPDAVEAWRDTSPLGLIGSTFPISAFQDDVSPHELLEQSSLAFNPSSQQYMVVWQAQSRTSGLDIYGRITAASGVGAASLFPISTAAGLQVSPSVAYESTVGQYLVTWSDLGTGNTSAIRLRRFSTSGTPIGGEITVSAAGTDAWDSRIACGGGRCVVVWFHDLGNGTGRILARNYDAQGNPTAGAVTLSETATVGFPDIACNWGASHCLVSWEQVASGWYDVIAVGLTGSLTPSPRVWVSTASGHQRYPRVGYTPGTYLVTWQDGRSGTSWDIWGQRLSTSFQLAGSNLNLFSGAYHEYAPAVTGLDTTSQLAVVYATDTNGGGLLQIHGCLVSAFGDVVNRFAVREWNNTRRKPAVTARLGGSEYLVTWTDDAHQTSSDILGRVVSSAGSFPAGHVAIARGRKGQEAPTVAYSPAHDEYLVVWMDYRNGSDYQIWGRRLTGAGAQVGTDFAIGNRTTSILYGLPAVAYNTTTNEYLVVWQEIPSQSIGYEIYARRVGWNGTLPAASFLVSRDSNAGNEGTPRVVYNSRANEFLVGWNAYDATGSRLWRAWGQRVSAAGTLAGSGFLISASTGHASPPRLAVNSGANQTLAIWQDFRNQGDNIFGQRVNGDGTLAGSNFQISASTGVKLGFSAIWGGSGYYLVSWSERRPDANVYAQRVAGNGMLADSEFSIANSTNRAELGPAVAVDSKNGGFLVAWQQEGGTTDTDIWARPVPKFDPPNRPAFAVSTAPDVQNLVEVEQDTKGTFLLVWQDFRANSYDIYGQLYSACDVECTASVPATGTPGVAVWFSSTANTVGCSETVSWDWDFGDGTTHGTTQNVGHTYTTTGTYTWRLTVSLPGGESCSRTGTIVIGSSACSVSCTANVPSASVTSTTTPFYGSAVVSGCASPASYDWDFGDGTPHGTARDELHTYAEGGTYTWRMTVTAGTATCVRSGSVMVAGPMRVWVPVISRASGHVGGWRSDLGILNRMSSVEAKVSLTARTGSGTLTASLTVPPKGQEILRDVALLLGLTSGSGSLELTSDQAVIVTSRTYNLQESGQTFGQGYDGVRVFEGLAAGQSAFVPQLTQNGSSGQTGTYRSNIGITNMGTTTARITLDLYDSAGGHLWSNTRDLAAGQWYQYNEPYRTGAGRNNVARGYARITVDSGGGVFAYGSVLDNGSSDPTTIVMRRQATSSPSGASVFWVPVISHAGGHSGGWRSDVGLLNRPGSGSASVGLTLRSGSQTYTGSVTVPDKGQDILLDAALLLGLSSGSGSLELSATRPLIVTSRTYNLQQNGWTYGQGYDGMTLEEGLATGQTAYLPQLTQNGNPGQVGTYRSNIGITNFGASTANVTLVLFDAQGNQVYTHTRDLTPGQWFQYNEPYRLGAGRNDIARGYARITVNSGSSVVAYASVIDNASSDPTTIMMRR